MLYGCIIHRETQTEMICELDDEMNITEDDEIPVIQTAPLYTSLCDLMGLDLHQTMLKIGLSDRPRETAARYSYLLTDKEFLDAYEGLHDSPDTHTDFSKLGPLFEWLHYLKAWFEGMQTDERLRDTELFRSYAEGVLGTDIPTLDMAGVGATRLKLNPLKPDYRAITDAFLNDIDTDIGEDVFFAKDFYQLLVMELYQLLRGGETVLTCRNCGKKFVTFTRSDALYCNRLSPQDETKTCKEYGAYFARLEKVRHDEATHIYKQIYNRLQNRYRRTKTPESPKGNLSLKTEKESFLAACKEWKQKIKNEQATEQDYITWLNQRKGELDNG